MIIKTENLEFSVDMYFKRKERKNITLGNKLKTYAKPIQGKL